jgi:plastocyanin
MDRKPSIDRSAVPRGAGPLQGETGKTARLADIARKLMRLFRRKRLAPTLVAISWLASLSSISAGTITGIVKAQGKQGAEESAAGGKYSSRQFKFAERVNYGEMHDFVVYIDGPVHTNVAAPDKPLQIVTSRPSSVSQRGAMFEPHVLPVMKGTQVQFPNNDEIYHNVFSFSEPKQFDLGLYKKDDPVESVQFDKTGRVDVFCSIHSRMNCIVLVLDNPYFASTDKHGHYSIQNVTPGTYKLKAWHERLPALTKEIIVLETGETNVDFTLGILNLPKP